MKDMLKQGEALFAQGKIEEAEKCFLNLLEKNSEYVEALNNLGAIYHFRGNFEKAESYFLKALTIKEDYLDALLNLADLYQNEKSWEEAAVQLEKYILVENRDMDSFNRLGMVYLEMGNIEKARIALKKSLKLNPDQEIVKESIKELEKRDSALSYLPKPGSFRGAFAEIDITPDVSSGHNPVLLQGMSGPPRSATGVSAPLMMQLLLLEDDHFTKTLFVAADLFGFGPEIVDNVRALTAQWGIEPEGLILNASHTHYAPGTISHASKSIGPFYSEYAKKIVQTIGQQLPILYNGLEECELSWGKVEARIGVSRRLKKDGKVVFAPNPRGYYDKDTPFLLLYMLKTDKKVLLVNHGCHPSGLGSENVISADYPGYMRTALKSNGVVDGVMFLQGGAGSTKETVSINGDVRFCKNSTAAKEKGEFLATQIMNGLEKGLQPVNGSFFCARRQISLPFKPLPPPSVLAQIRDNAGTNDLTRECASGLLNRFSNGDFPTRLAMEIQLISLGDKVSFVTLPAEPVAELARDLRRLTSNPDSTFVLGYTNGLIGYLPTDVMIEEGGYETEASQFAYLLPSALNTGTESAIISATEKCVSAAEDRGRPNGYGRYHLAKKKQKAFFVLSTGRCGTMTLAHLLNTSTNARVWHHSQPDPIKESLLAYWGDIDKRKAFWKARYPIIHKTWSEGLVHGETDLLMTPFCDMLAEEIPDAKFIVLVRNPRDFVRSGMRRNYYHGHPWDFGRLRPQEGTEDFESWSKLDQFGKVCWLWAKTYEYILRITSAISKDRVLVVRFEDLVRDHIKVKEIFEFFGLEDFDRVKIEGILQKKLNSQSVGNFPEVNEWSNELLTKLCKETGQIASALGYRDKLDENKGLAKCVQTTTTVWDFKKFKHQEYPDHIDVELFRVRKSGFPLIAKSTKIVSMGSCFARNIAEYLLSKKYNYLVTETPFQQASARWDQVFNIACIRQIFEYTFDNEWRPLVRWWPKNGMVQDPFRRSILYKKETCVSDFDRHRKASYKALTEAEVIILTLGLIEIWRDKRDKMTYYRVPSPRLYNQNIHEFYIQNVSDCLRDLNKVHRLLQKNNPNVNIIVSVSPVPLFATFRMDVDVVTANLLSKSTLRVAAEYFSAQHDNVHYFPSYEIVTQAIPNPYEDDNRHVTKETVNKVMNVFESQFMVPSQNLSCQLDFEMEKPLHNLPKNVS